jgi:hypothetical protein
MLSNFISVIVPATKNVNENLTDAEHLQAVRDVATQLSRKCGGASAERVLGFWVSDVVGLVEEKTTRVKSFYNPDEFPTVEAVEFIRKIAAELKDQFSQEAVLIETEQGIDFI